MKTFAIALIVTLTGTLLFAANPYCPGGVCRVIYPNNSYQLASSQYATPTTYSQPSYNREHHHRQVIRVVNIATVAQINPAYASSYNPDGYDSATQADMLAEIRRLSALVAAQNRAVAVVPTPVGPVVVPVTPVTPVTPGPVGKVPATAGQTGIQVLNAKCAACHQTGKLAPEQRFTLLDAKGNLATLTDKQKTRVLTKTYSGQMPPPLNSLSLPALTDPEYAALVELLSSN
jgi:mono/diheme cytochrome c family protein